MEGTQNFDMDDMPIEDMAYMLSDQFPLSENEWQGIYLGYVEDVDSNSYNQQSQFLGTDAFDKLSSSPTLLKQHLEGDTKGLLSATSTSSTPNAGSVFGADQFAVEAKTDDRSGGSSPPGEHPGPDGASRASKRPWESGCAGNDACRTIYTDVMRGERKKSREKLRRMEVNGKFDELALLLGLTDKSRKGHVLQEAINTIKEMTRQRDILQREKLQLQQEISKLTSCLHFAHTAAGRTGPGTAVAPPMQAQLLGFGHQPDTGLGFRPMGLSSQMDMQFDMGAPIAPKPETPRSSQGAGGRSTPRRL